jgi:hypothetical protein
MKKELKNKFRSFLKRKNLLKKFEDELKKRNKTFDQYFANLSPSFWFNSAFIFPPRERGYWLKINSEWLNILKN